MNHATDKTESQAIALRTVRFPWFPLLVYGLGILIVGMLMRDQINPDAVSYIENARHLVAGHIGASVSGYWSPLLSWSIAPLLYVGVDGLYAARIALGLWGAVLIIACWCLMRRLQADGGIAQTIALTLIAICTVRWATYVITPDLLLAACLMLYCQATLSPKLLEGSQQAAHCGVLGGVAYLAKSYALPFFLAHFAFCVALRWFWNRDQYTPRQAARQFACGLIAFLAVGGPWIAALSWKYQGPTFSTVARVAHTVIGPADEDRDHPLDGLHAIPAGRLYVWETPEALTYNHWSPLQNWNYLLHQAKYSLGTSLKIVRTIGSFDFLYLSVPALILTPLLLRDRSQANLQLAFWFLGTVLIFSLGFTLVYFEARYITPFLWPLICVYCATAWPRQLGLRGAQRAVLSGLVVTSFGVVVAYNCDAMWQSYRVDRARYRRVAHELRSDLPPGSLAFVGRRHEGLYMAYHSERPFVGWLWTPRETEVSQLESQLNEHAAGVLLIDSRWPQADEFRARTTWRQRQTLPYQGATIDVYTPAKVGPTAVARD